MRTRGSASNWPTEITAWKTIGVSSERESPVRCRGGFFISAGGSTIRDGIRTARSGYMTAVIADGRAISFTKAWRSMGASGKFNGDLLHFPYRDWKDHDSRIERYTELAAKAARSKGRRSNVLKLILAPPLTFLKSFVLQAGFLDGWRGAAIAYMGARYVFKREFRILR